MLEQVAPAETKQILALASSMLDVAGDFVELGCYEGDTSLLLAELLKKSNSSKKLWIYDSFVGLPEKTAPDHSSAGENFQAGTLATTKRAVKLRFLRAGLPVPIIKKAWFQDLTAADLPATISFAFLDGDFYESIKISLALVSPRLSQQGIMIVHDYHNVELPGVTHAVDEWLVGNHYHLNQIGSLAILSR